MVSTFWKSVLHALCISPALSNVYHPQTDGKTEQSNQTLETYLKRFCSHHHDDWSNWLPMAEFNFNNLVSASTKNSPYFSWQGFHPQANSFSLSPQVPKADAFVCLLEDVQVILEESFSHWKVIWSLNYNWHSRSAPPYLVGHWFWLTRRFIPRNQLSYKPDYRKNVPFQINKLIGKNTVWMELGHLYARLHPVFNVSLILPYVDPSIGGSPKSLAQSTASSRSVVSYNWLLVSGILDFHSWGKQSYKYPLRWLHGITYLEVVH